MQLVIESLSKTYPTGVNALNQISLSLREGIFGLLGPNGAGKSTLMRILTTLQEPDRGTVLLNGLDVVRHKTQVRQQLGYLPQDFSVYPRISAEDMLDHIARLKGINQATQRKQLVAALLDKVNLTKDKKKNLGTYSGGMKQRFGIAQALIGNPTLIIVDEPTAGLDPAERNRFYFLLSQLGQEAIVILSTHIVEDVSTLCQQFAILDKGQIRYRGEPDQALQAMEGRIFTRLIHQTELPIYQDRYQVLSGHLKAGQIQVRIFSEQDLGPGFSRATPTLEDAYFATINAYTSVR